MKTVLSFAFCVLLSTLVSGQGRGQQSHRGHRGLAQYAEQLNLSDAQLEELSTIKAATRQQVEAIRNEALTVDQRRAKMREIMKKSRQSAEAILTPSQQDQLKEIMADKQESRRANHQDRKAMRAELQQYREENIRPTMLALRRELEPSISSEDRQELDRLRAIMASRPDRQLSETQMEQTKGDREARMQLKEERKRVIKTWRAEHEADFTALKAIIRTYKPQMEQLFSQLEDKQIEWKEDLQAIQESHTKNSKANDAVKGHRAKRKHQRAGGKEMGYAKFLLMDPKG